MSENQKPSANPLALLPIGLFLVLYLGNGIYFEYIKPEDGQMGFYVVSVVLAFSISLIVAFLQNRKRTFDEKIHSCARAQGKGADVRHNQALFRVDLSGNDPGQDRRTHGYGVFRVNGAEGRFSEEGRYIPCDHGHAGGSANQENMVDLLP